VNLDLRTGGTAGEAAGDTFTDIENVIGSDFNDYIFGDDGNNSIEGGIGADRLRGGDGDDTLIGGDDADNLIGGAGADVLDGGDGIDVANYAGASVRVNLDLRASGTAGDAAGDAFVSIENVKGTSFNDFIFGNGLDNLIEGGKGDDRLRGDAGNDTLIGGDGDDNLISGLGSNVLDGGKGEDTLILSESTGDTAHGGDDNDTIVASFVNAAIIDGGDGIDTLEFSNTFDIVNGLYIFDLDLGFSTAGGDYIGDWSNLENLIGFNKVEAQFVGNAADNLLRASIYEDTLVGEGGRRRCGACEPQHRQRRYCG